ncbi:Lactose transport system permease protein LacF [Tritonibacter multivorans]|uniref:Lactose transport system permease protein LacF n=1 Tax=Tritonibacter multivorans TaxID=928856 RepID=A0A0N7M0R0_9RHOB|nr:sugar ABC transporter permease [Tritonibacter multivorans]MDA7420669.1 sugar ABC transporter permease [Tritonibacter multivorans]CUH81161.1 Lactose transport system permease protein LacF [Tritonibacter multivorans]SFC29705.1 carbohydrate ABC transporter membrane protein 1, CUT1 family [Tritonibacter multivorans]
MQRNWIHAWLLLSPAFVFLLAFTHIPAVTTLWNSLFTTPRGRRPSRWAGLENYETLIADPIFWKVLSNNIWFALGTIPTSIAIALAMALWVNEKLAGRGFLRMAYFTPTVLPMIAVANIWMFFYTPGFGLIDQITGRFGLPQSNILGQPDTALWGVMAVTIWKEAGFFMIFYLAALQTIPPSLIEAARIEGAGPWTIFRRVTFPLLMPTTLFVSINAVVNSFRMVDHIFILTGGGPDNASSLLLFYIYEVAFRFWDTAYAATLTVILLAILGLLAIGQFFLFDRKVHYR